MLGWDFSPRLSGGVGSACGGLATALARAGTEVLFVLPRLRGDEEPGGVQLVAAEARAVPARASASVASGGRTPASEPDEPASAESLALPPELPPPGASLRLLALESPLRPYQTEEEYARAVRRLLERVRADPPRATARRRSRPAAAEPVAPLPRRAPGAPAPLPPGPLPYGTTRFAEVERYARAALAAVEGESFDVVHAHDWMTFPAALLLREQSGKPLCVHFHSCEFERRGARAVREVRALEQAALDAAERVLCVSHASARTLREHYALEFAKVRVLHNAFAPLPVVERGPRPAPVVLFLGRLAEQKGPHTFLAAAARVRARHPTARFDLAGDGELYPEVRQQARALDLEGAVRFTGFVDGEELARAYAGADVYVMPSRSEPFGIGALEALSLGVPTIVARGAGVTEVVRSVLTFDAGDAEALADKICALLERPSLRRSLVATGLSEVKRLRWDGPARALRGIYGEVVA